jgi:hypothetical protein
MYESLVSIMTTYTDLLSASQQIAIVNLITNPSAFVVQRSLGFQTLCVSANSDKAVNGLFVFQTAKSYVQSVRACVCVKFHWSALKDDRGKYTCTHTMVSWALCNPHLYDLLISEDWQWQENKGLISINTFRAALALTESNLKWPAILWLGGKAGEERSWPQTSI